MAQETEQREGTAQQARAETTTSVSQRAQDPALSPGVQVLVPLIVLFDLLAMALVAIEGLTSLFVPLYIGVVLTYIFGGLYLFKKLMEYYERPLRRRPPTGR
ncbi:MAG: hypothetical protein ABSF83_03130 [Nitrososphaerales archaeon]|jgi:flagellar biosynthesis protein FliQ